MRLLLFVILLSAAPVTAQELVSDPTVGPQFEPAPNFLLMPQGPVCSGDGCDAYLPTLNRSTRFDDTSARRKWGAALGGLSGALIGEDIGGAPGAVALGVFGVFLGHDYIDRDRWEKDATAYGAAWQRGDDTFYNPANRLPLEAHWMHAGPARRGTEK